ncbi:MAG: AMP-binding protein [Bacteroidetes bacterium]|nr:AMP-binding protein [Bacteroidota bacterium]
METTFPKILFYRAHAHPGRMAYVFNDQAFTYQMYFEKSLEASRYLKSLGLKKGDRFGILDFNNPSVIHLISGAMLLGIIPVCLNWRAMPDDLLFVTNDAGIDYIFFGSSFKKLIDATPFPQNIHNIEIEKLFVENNQSIINHSDEIEISEDDICTLLYTSGTTGNPKGVMLTYKNLYSCYLLCALDTPSFGPDTRNLVCGPMYSIFGYGAFFAGIYAGCTNVLLWMFDAEGVCKNIMQHKVSNALLIPAMFPLILGMEGVESMDFSSLRHIQYGGSPVSGKMLLRMKNIFHCYFTQVYGLTESGGVGTALRYDDHEMFLKTSDQETNNRLLSAGKCALGIEVSILNSEFNDDYGFETGEILIRGENIAKGYWNMPELTTETFDKDGWLHTGDIGYIDADGYLFLVDRLNDKIVCKGVNIYPAEIEKVLIHFPGFKDVAVIAVPDEKAGEAVCAIAVCDKENISLTDLQKWCEGKMAYHKIPKHLEKVDALPRNPTGKILRRVLREPFWKKESRNIKG